MDEYGLKRCLEECMKKYSFVLPIASQASTLARVLRLIAEECYKKCRSKEGDHGVQP
jgi:hypothetical protein